MHTLHLFCPRSRSAADLLVPKPRDFAVDLSDFEAEEECDPEAEVRGLIGCWDRYCPQLREVQLLPGFVWRKAEVRPGEKKGSWEKREYHWVNGVRDYVYCRRWLATSMWDFYGCKSQRYLDHFLPILIPSTYPYSIVVVPFMTTVSLLYVTYNVIVLIVESWRR